MSYVSLKDWRIFTNLLLFLLIGGSFSGCLEGNLDLQVRFDRIDGLKKGDRVFFQDNPIGRVMGASYLKEGYYIADVEIKKNFKKAVTDYSRFFIVPDPVKQGAKAIEMLEIKRGGLALKNGAVVNGSTKISAVLEKMGKEFEKGVAVLDKQLDKFSEEMKSLPEKEEVKRFQQEMERLSKEMGEAVSSFRLEMQEELLPRIEKEIEKLKEKLKKSGREKKAEPLQTQMDQPRKI